MLDKSRCEYKHEREHSAEQVLNGYYKVLWIEQSQNFGMKLEELIQVEEDVYSADEIHNLLTDSSGRNSNVNGSGKGRLDFSLD